MKRNMLTRTLVLEQKTAIQIIGLLYEKQMKWSDILKALPTSQHPAYTARSILLGVKAIITVLLDEGSFYTLTDKGRSIAQKLLEIEEIMKGD